MPTILITGATAGIGKSIAQKFANTKDWSIVVTGRRQERLDSLKTELESQGVSIQTYNVDVRDRAGMAAFAQALIDSQTAVDVLINNAGLAKGFGPIDQGSFDDWDTMIDTNIKGLLNATKLILPLLKQSNRPHIVNIGSIAGKNAYKNGNVYCATKFAVDALTKAMRIDLLPYQIKVSAVNPGAVETEFSLVRYDWDAEKAKTVYEGFQPLTPNDIVDIVYFMVNVPKHVCINDLTVTCLTQANSNYSIKDHEIIK